MRRLTPARSSALFRGISRGVRATKEALSELVRTAVRKLLPRTAWSIAFGGICALTGCQLAQSVDVAGVVINAQTGDPIEGVQLVADDGARARSDSLGRFGFHITRARARTITATREGHRATTQTIDATRSHEHVVLRLVEIDSLSDVDEWRTVDDDVSSAHAPPFDDVRTERMCASCHDMPVDAHFAQWSRSRMSDRAPHAAQRTECVRCHTNAGFLASAHGGPDGAEVGQAEGSVGCRACHDAHSPANPAALRFFDHVELASGRSAHDLGSGAVCAACHQVGETGQRALRAPHAPQADVMIGVGARTVGQADGGVHAHIADTCVRCHMTQPDGHDPRRDLVGGHTFSLAGWNADSNTFACAPCHGEETPRESSRAYDRRLAEVSSVVQASIARARVDDGCPEPTIADDVTDLDARLVLVGARGLLGDCDRDGVISQDEHAVTIEHLEPQLRDAVYDLRLLRADGSRGVHNPEYVRTILNGVERAAATVP